MDNILAKNIITAAAAKFEADHTAAVTNLSLYLNSATAIAEHPDIVSEAIKLIQKITEAEDNLRTIANFQKQIDSSKEEENES